MTLNVKLLMFCLIDPTFTILFAMLSNWFFRPCICVFCNSPRRMFQERQATLTEGPNGACWCSSARQSPGLLCPQFAYALPHPQQARTRLPQASSRITITCGGGGPVWAGVCWKGAGHELAVSEGGPPKSLRVRRSSAPGPVRHPQRPPACVGHSLCSETEARGGGKGGGVGGQHLPRD